MTDTRMVRLEQIAAGPFNYDAQRLASLENLTRISMKLGLGEPMIKVKQVGDVTGGDVFEPSNCLEATLLEALRRCVTSVRHLVQVEVVNG